MLPNTSLFAGEARPQEDVTVGDFLFATSVCAANVVKDIRENVRNLTGGNLEHYESLADQGVERALERLAAKAKSKNYDGVLAIQISHPHFVEGAVAVVVSGNGFTTVNNPQRKE